MKGKLILVFGFAVGYVLGARAGRKRFEQIKTVAVRLWDSPQVQGALGQAEGFIKAKAPEVSAKLEEGARFVASVVGTKKSEEDSVKTSTKAQPKSASTSARSSKPATKSTAAASKTTTARTRTSTRTVKKTTEAE